MTVKKRKKAQIQTQIFIYIVAIVVVSLILLYGYRAIAGMRKQAEQVEFITFKTELEAAVSKISHEYGSVDIKTFNLPGKYREICFVKWDSIGDPGFDMTGYPIIENSVIDEIKNNVFLVESPSKVEPLEVGDVVTYDDTDDDGVLIEAEKVDSLCIPSLNGRVNIRFEGAGDHVKVSEAVPE